jgi:DNA uptake protein ComE-like DNA-binding protein
MIVNEFGQTLTSKELNTQLEGVYKWRLNLSQMSESDARHTLNKVHTKITNIKNSSLAHHAERNPQFTEAMLVSQIIETWLNERAVMLAERTLTPGEQKKRENYVKGMKKHKGSFEKRYGKRGEDVMYATATKMAKKESVEEAMNVLKSVISGVIPLNEGEVDHASAIVAARGMVDEIQKMVEKISSMVNEDLPPLMDTIRDRVGADQSAAFGAAATQTLTPLLDAVKAAREGMDAAARTVAGEQTAAPTMASGTDLTSGAGPGADLSLATPAASPNTQEMPNIPRADDEEFATSDAAVGGKKQLGRSKRA